MFTVEKSWRILKPGGQKQVGATITWEIEKKFIAVCSVTASEKYIPPTVI
jgi:hypothetical protein